MKQIKQAHARVTNAPPLRRVERELLRFLRRPEPERRATLNAGDWSRLAPRVRHRLGAGC
jgi:hypothetical protein